MFDTVAMRNNYSLYLKYQSYIEEMERLGVGELKVEVEIFPGFKNTEVLSYEHCFKCMDIAWQAIKNEDVKKDNPRTYPERKRKTKTHCANGHLLTEQNITYDKSGFFRCGDCARLRHQKYQAKQKGLPFP